MAKATDTQIKDVQAALKLGKPLPPGVRVNFGDPEPIQKTESALSEESGKDKGK